MIAGILAGGRPVPPTAPGASDPYWANVVSLLHFAGSADSTTFTDERGKIWAAGGNAKLSSVDSRFGGTSLICDGSADHITTPAHADFGFAAGDFTVEFWVRRSNNNQFFRLFGLDSGGTSQLLVQMMCAEDAAAYLVLTVSGTQILTSTTLIPALPSPWSHVALVRAGGTYKFFIDGVFAGSAASAVSLPQCSVYFGGTPSGSIGLYGYADELRITKGLARYSANFTPPTDAFPDA